MDLIQRLRDHTNSAGARLAVVADDGSLSYQELDQLSTKAGVGLRRLGVQPGQTVAVDLGRSAQVIVAILAAMKEGIAYTIRENGSDGRGTTLQGGPAAPIALTIASPVPDGTAAGGEMTVRMDDLLVAGAVSDDRDKPAEIAPDTTAYVIFTSGSTGTPKAVAVTRQNIAHYTTALLDRLQITEGLAYAHVSSLAADLGNTCIFLPLWTGGCIHLLGDETRRDPLKLAAYLADRRIDVLKLAPSHWTAMCGSTQSGMQNVRLRYLILGGERLATRVVEAALRCELAEVVVNHYGPTETTVGVAANAISHRRQLDDIGDAVPIGLPLGRTVVLVRAEDGALRSSGATGELLIGGPSVSAGYIGNPDANQSKFISCPGWPGRFYCTGDLVEVDGGGCITFLGRTDRQVKLLGYRVELEHVETELRSIPAVVDAYAAVVSVAGRPRLRAALVPRGELEIGALRKALRERVPKHMIPSDFLVLSRMPLTANGKSDGRTVTRMLERLETGHPVTEAHQAGAQKPDQLAAQILDAWTRVLGRGGFTLESNFFDEGGTSIDAIQVVADLQARGQEITANDILEAPVLADLAARLSAPRHSGPTLSAWGRDDRIVTTALSAAQCVFFDSEPAERDFWNQAVVLECEAEIATAQLQQALGEVLRVHPMLRTAFRRAEGEWYAQVLPVAPDDVLTIEAAAGYLSADLVEDRAQRLHRSIRIEQGYVFKIHVIRCQGGRDLLILVAHHLVVDVVSWRIILSDLFRIYDAALAGRSGTLPDRPGSLWRFVEHLASCQASYGPDLAFWRPVLEHKRGMAAVLPETTPDLENEAASLWFGIPWADILAQSAALGFSSPVQTANAAVLAAFCSAFAEQQDLTALPVDIESHGRASVDGLDLARAVGWFTATFPILVDCDGGVAAMMRRIAETLTTVPHEGVAYQLFRSCSAIEPPQSSILYNFLGAFPSRFPGSLGASLSLHDPGSARGGRNVRGHGLKLTARIIHGQLAVDLSYSPGRLGPDAGERLMARTRDLVLDAIGLPQSLRRPLVSRRHSATGLLAYMPRELAEPAPAAAAPRRVHDRSEVVLTGATGFVGIHVLQGLLSDGQDKVQCLIRSDGGEAALRKLEATYRWYFPGDRLLRYRDRVSVTATDDLSDWCGLDGTACQEGLHTVGSIFHFAANTKLFGRAEEFEAINIRAVEALIRFASIGRPKTLHHMSTLAVAGVNLAPKPIAFTEDTLAYGQEFQNHYERSKFSAEVLVRDFQRAGGAGFIYRAGDVSGHSGSGRFQRNAADNRLVQFLKAIVRQGELPTSIEGEVAFSPVDSVAAAILAIARSPESQPATYHVDSQASIPLAEVFAELSRLGADFRRSKAGDFSEILSSRKGAGDAAAALGYFWARRRSRNVVFDHSWTHGVLRGIGAPFVHPDRSWLSTFLEGLRDRGELNLAAMGSAKVA
jgi:amino acid adenylation domain-containing protein/thioester reductase-like protein